jgi:tetratricopeptide (TPR) repeat protein
LTEDSNPNPNHVAYYALRVLLLDDRPDVREARRCLGVIEKLQPDPTTITIELKARLLDAEGNPAGAVAAVKGYVDRDPERGGYGALLLERLGAAEPAEQMLRAFAADPKKVAGTILLAGFLGRQDRAADALTVLADRLDTLPPVVPAVLGTQALYNATRAAPPAVRQVEGWVRRAAEKGLPERDVLSMRAVLKVVEKQYGDAIQLYEEAVRTSGEKADPLVMNNLGYLLAIHAGRPADGLGLVRKARDATDSRPGIVDTEALILTATGEPQKAIELLAGSTVEAPRPASLYHLAEAYRAAGDEAAAVAAMRQAVRWKILPIDVPPSDREKLRAALRQIGKR